MWIVPCLNGLASAARRRTTGCSGRARASDGVSPLIWVLERRKRPGETIMTDEEKINYKPWGTRYIGKDAVRAGLSARFETTPDVHYGAE